MVYVGLCDNGMIAFARSCFFCGLWVAFDSPFLWFVVLLDSAVSLFFMSSVVSFCQNLGTFEGCKKFQWIGCGFISI
jgi:hypothetical protein